MRTVCRFSVLGFKSFASASRLQSKQPAQSFVLFMGVNSLQDKQKPGRAVQKKVEPVKRLDKPSPKKHTHLFKEVRRPIRGKAEGQTEKNYCCPGKLIKQICHEPSSRSLLVQTVFSGSDKEQADEHDAVLNGMRSNLQAIALAEMHGSCHSHSDCKKDAGRPEEEAGDQQ